MPTMEKNRRQPNQQQQATIDNNEVVARTTGERRKSWKFSIHWATLTALQINMKDKDIFILLRL